MWWLVLWRIHAGADLLAFGIGGDSLTGINQPCEYRWCVLVRADDAGFHKQVSCPRLAAHADVTGRESCRPPFVAVVRRPSSLATQNPVEACPHLCLCLIDKCIKGCEVGHVSGARQQSGKARCRGCGIERAAADRGAISA